MRDRIKLIGVGLGLVLLAAGPRPARGQGVAFQPVPAPIFDGVNLGVTPAVSADRRYVRLGVNAGFQVVNGFTTLSVPAAVGGGGNGGGLGGLGGLGGGAGGGAGGVGGRVGFAGMNGPIVPGDGFGPGAGFGPGPGFGMGGMIDPTAAFGSPYALGMGDPRMFQPVARPKKSRAKAVRPAAKAAARPAAKADAKPAPAAALRSNP